MMMPSVAVIDAAPESVAVWHVAIDNDSVGISRMCGAWVYAGGDLNNIDVLTRGRYVVATPTGADVLTSLQARPAGFIDLPATLNGVAAERDRLNSIYEGLPATRKKTLTAPRWPRLPDPVDLADPPRAHNAGD